MEEQKELIKKEETNPQLNVDWTEKLQLVKDTVAKKCTDAEFELLCYTAKMYHLNPLKKEIFAVKYLGSPANIMVGRDGFASIAHQSGQFDGLETKFHKAENEDDSSATCSVYRKDMSHPVSVTVYMNEYKSASSPLWRTKSRTMLCKVAESQALRKAFNISGIYSPDEFSDSKPEQVNVKEEASNVSLEVKTEKQE